MYLTGSGEIIREVWAGEVDLVSLAVANDASGSISSVFDSMNLEAS